jgi:hypothetical protein
MKRQMGGVVRAKKNVNLIVTLDTKKNRIVVYSQIIQLFEIVEYYDIDENDIDKVDNVLL